MLQLLMLTLYKTNSICISDININRTKNSRIAKNFSAEHNLKHVFAYM